MSFISTSRSVMYYFQNCLLFFNIGDGNLILLKIWTLCIVIKSHLFNGKRNLHLF